MRGSEGRIDVLGVTTNFRFFSTVADGTVAELDEDAARILTIVQAHEHGNDAEGEGLTLAGLARFSIIHASNSGTTRALVTSTSVRLSSRPSCG